MKGERTAWQRHEIIWLKAALTLKCERRCAAYRDIASMSGRTLRAVQAKADRIKANKSLAATWASFVVVPARYVPNPNRIKADRRIMARAA